MTLVDGEKAVERALDTAADGGGGSPVLRMRGPGREDTGVPISRESREPRAESRRQTNSELSISDRTQTRDHGPDSGRARHETPHPPPPDT